MPNFLHFTDKNSLQLRCKFRYSFSLGKEKSVAKQDSGSDDCFAFNTLPFRRLHACNTIAQHLLRQKANLTSQQIHANIYRNTCRDNCS